MWIANVAECFTKNDFFKKIYIASLKGYNSTQTQPPSLPQLPITLGQEKLSSLLHLAEFQHCEDANHWLLIHISHMGRLHGKHFGNLYLNLLVLSSSW